MAQDPGIDEQGSGRSPRSGRRPRDGGQEDHPEGSSLEGEGHRRSGRGPRLAEEDGQEALSQEDTPDAQEGLIVRAADPTAGGPSDLPPFVFSASPPVLAKLSSPNAARRRPPG